MVSRKWIDRAIFLGAVSTIVGRCIITPRLDLPTAEGSYEAFAHLFVGALFGAGITRKDAFWFGIAIGLSLFELVMFLLQKFSPV